MNYRVYFIGEDPYTNKVKIGKTNNVKNRIRTLQTGNPYKLRIIGTISCQDEKTMSELEKRLHNELKDKRLVGEWFNVTMDEVVVLHARENGIPAQAIEQVALIEEVRNEQLIMEQPINNKKCYNCGSVFRTPSDLLKHKNRKTPCLIREVAPENIRNPNRCIYCNRVFVQHCSMTRHLSICKIKNVDA